MQSRGEWLKSVKAASEAMRPKVELTEEERANLYQLPMRHIDIDPEVHHQMGPDSLPKEVVTNPYTLEHMRKVLDLVQAGLASPLDYIGALCACHEHGLLGHDDLKPLMATAVEILKQQ